MIFVKRAERDKDPVGYPEYQFLGITTYYEPRIQHGEKEHYQMVLLAKGRLEILEIHVSEFLNEFAPAESQYNRAYYELEQALRIEKEKTQTLFKGIANGLNDIRGQLSLLNDRLNKKL